MASVSRIRKIPSAIGAGMAAAILGLSALTAAGAPFVGVFPEPRELSVRVFDAGIPVRWVPGGGGPQPSGAPSTSVA